MDVWLRPALVVIDVQRAIDAPYWAASGPRNNPTAEAVIDKLIGFWREHKWPIVHVRHSSVSDQSSYHARSDGFAFKYAVTPSSHEVVVTKRANSAFVNTSLNAELKQLRCDRIVMCGVTTNHSVDVSVRHAAALGYKVRLVSDACAAFPLRLADGRIINGEDVHQIFTANLSGEYCEVVQSAQIIA
ncbi:cysteine hydrolase family protein [Simiduia litorea]|uniref:cysteine hydrolase family protein n=1 Tax=Simiduia litorea TaxID=1435348 RepID=UPI0036F1D139